MLGALNLNQVRTTTQFFSFLHSYPQIFGIFSMSLNSLNVFNVFTRAQALVPQGLAGKCTPNCILKARFCILKARNCILKARFCILRARFCIPHPVDNF